MRLWTVHPKYLDAKGLVALWREALLAKQVLAGRTRGYRHHPQLHRFRDHAYPAAAINAYLAVVLAESKRRGYRFDGRKARAGPMLHSLAETRGQLLYEWNHLLEKLRVRDPERFSALQQLARPKAHPLFRIVAGDVRPWERRGAQSVAAPHDRGRSRGRKTAIASAARHKS